MGPLISRSHQKKVLDYIETGNAEGAELLCGGGTYHHERSKGNFVQPTVFANTKPGMKIVREEIFGPVLVVQLFDSEEEAVALANDTIYGLAGGVFTSDGARAQRFFWRLRAGITWINTYHPTFNEAPWGGYKQSGMAASSARTAMRPTPRSSRSTPISRPRALAGFGTSNISGRSAKF